MCIRDRGMGTSGAAIATGLSQLISFTVLLCQCNLRKECISIRLRNFKPSLSLYGQVINGGMPSLGRQGMASLATIVLNTTARPYGDAAIAAMAIVNRFIDVYKRQAGYCGGHQRRQHNCRLLGSRADSGEAG